MTTFFRNELHRPFLTYLIPHTPYVKFISLHIVCKGGPSDLFKKIFSEKYSNHFCTGCPKSDFQVWFSKDFFCKGQNNTGFGLGGGGVQHDLICLVNYF